MAKTITRSIRLNPDQVYKLDKAIEILNQRFAPAKVTGQTLFIHAFEEYLEKHLPELKDIKAEKKEDVKNKTS